MSNTIGRFGFQIVKMKESDKIPFSSIVTICLDRWTKTKDGAPTISPHLMTEREIDNYIRDLKDDLDSVGRKAKAALKRARESTQKILAKRNSK